MTEPPPGSSPRARWFAIAFGIVAPLLCVAFDPIVFLTSALTAGGDGAYLGTFRAFGYVAIVLAAVLLLRALRRPSIHGIEAGMLYGASLTSLILGVVLLPVTLIGVFLAGLGLLGLTPFLTSWTYFRAARAKQTRGWKLTLAGMLLFAAVPAAAQIITNASVAWAIANVDRSGARTVLRMARLLFDSEQLVDRYVDATSDAEKERISRSFHSMTGSSIEERLQVLAD